jgi:phosphatidate cytidylyltransferase
MRERDFRRRRRRAGGGALNRTVASPTDSPETLSTPSSEEGVRIIGAEEAKTAIDTGRAAGRRIETGPVNGDAASTSTSTPTSPSPVVDAGSSPSGSSSPEGPRRTPSLQHWAEPPSGEHPRILPEDDDDLQTWASLASRGPRWRDQPRDWEADDYDDVSSLAGDDTRVGALDPKRPGAAESFSPEGSDAPQSSSVAERALRRAPRTEAGRQQDDPTSIEPRGALRGRQIKGSAGQEHDELPPRTRSLRPRSALSLPGDVFDGVDDPEAPDLTEVEQGHGPRDQEQKALVRSTSGRNLPVAVVTGMSIAIVFLLLARLGPGPTVALITVILVMAMAELCAALRRRGYQPATLLGLVATASLSGAAYWRGLQAFPLLLALFVIFGLLWYLMGVVRANPTLNVSVTLLAFSYVGVLGAFAALILRAFPDGMGVLLGAVIGTVAYDVMGLLAGTRLGKTPLAPSISPHKTVEGLLVGAVGAVVASVLITRQITPWDFGSSFALGLLVAVAAPLGDLCESMIKRDLGVKDMGSALPGHGGVLDRIDGLLFVIPATYYLVQLLGRV